MTRAAALAGWATLAVFVGLILLPVAALFGRAEGPGGFGPADWAAVRFTLVQALISAALSCALAVPFARALMRRRFPGRVAILALLGAPFLLPVIVAILGLLAVWGRSGAVSDLLSAAGWPRLSIYGMTGVVLAHVFFNLPLVARLLVQGWLDVPAERFRLAAQLGLPPGTVFRLIEMPILRQVLPGAFLLVFLLCMTSFAVALALGGGPAATTIELAIYQAIRFGFDLSGAAALALVQLGLCGAVVVLALLVARPAGMGAGLGRPRRRWDAPGGAARIWDAAVIAAALAFLATPMLFVVTRGGAALLGGVPAGLPAALGTSLVLALSAAVLSTLGALALAGLVLRLGRGRAALAEAAVMAMLATSPFVIGTGLFILINPWADPFAFALIVTLAVNVALSVPFALRALVPAFEAARADWGRLADSLGMEGWARFRLVTLPLIRRPLGFAAGLAAALSMGDLGVITLFAPPGVETLPLYMYRLMDAYRMEDAAAAALVLLAASLALFWLFDRGGRVGHPA